MQSLIAHPKLVACADGGANKAMSVGYSPDIIVGDLDSFVRTGNNFEHAEIIKVDSQKDTDFEKVLNFLLDRGFNEILVTAFSGGRIDQTLANLQIAYQYSRKCKIILADNQYLIFPAHENLSLDFGRGVNVSLVPMEDETILSTSGLKYELHRDSLRKGGQGISNRATNNRIEIAVHKGGLLVFVEDTKPCQGLS
jgi:thiamine pyrophosphokinase